MIALIAALRPLALLLWTLRLVPLEGPDHPGQLLHRMLIVQAALAATSDPVEQLVLIKIPAKESRYRLEVGSCQVRSVAGARTAWQLIPFDKAEAGALCFDTYTDAAFALLHVRESRRMCRHLPAREQLAAYACGHCDDQKCKDLSAERWP